MTTLVTGGTGSFGHALVLAIRDVIVFSRDEEKQRRMALEFPDCRYVIGDVRDRDAVRRAMQGCDTVIHAAALKQIGTAETHPGEAIRTNVLGTENVAITAAETGTRMVLLSTDKAVEPVNAYGATKLLAERVTLDYGGTVVRYGNVLGSRGSIVPVFRAQVAIGKPLTITDPKMTRFVLTLPEAVALVLEALTDGRRLLIRRSPSATVMQFAQAIASGHPFDVIGPRPGEKRHETLLRADEGGPVTSDAAPRLTTEELRALIEQVPP